MSVCASALRCSFALSANSSLTVTCLMMQLSFRAEVEEFGDWSGRQVDTGIALHNFLCFVLSVVIVFSNVDHKWVPI